MARHIGTTIQTPDYVSITGGFLTIIFGFVSGALRAAVRLLAAIALVGTLFGCPSAAGAQGGISDTARAVLALSFRMEVGATPDTVSGTQSSTSPHAGTRHR